MSRLAGVEIVVGVTGGIAVYKAVEVVSRLKKLGAIVNVIMTKEATEFVTELTFREITGNPVTVSMWEKVTNYHVAHISLAERADIMLVVPATANIIAKTVHGIADDMLTTTLLASKAKKIFAPAMNTNMWDNPITQDNIAKLKDYGVHFIEPASGELACGTIGKGRLPEPIDIIEAICDYAGEHGIGSNASHKSLANKHILITAGGTIEPLDPVRYLGNRSTGRMGYAIATEAVKRGAKVTLVTGPSSLAVPPGVKVIKIETAREMYDAVMAEFAEVDAVVKAAAVADYRPKVVATNKIKKSDGEFTIKLERNPDILFELGQHKKHQVLVGFAAETERVDEYARGKLTKKNLDFIVANNVAETDAGFAVDTNHVKIFFANGEEKDYPLMPKKDLAGIILDELRLKLAK